MPIQNFAPAWMTDEHKMVFDSAKCFMTEPDTGSDLQGVRTLAQKSEDGQTYKINGSKTFITNGQLANLIIVVYKIGMEAQDTSELFFDDVVVSKYNLIGGQEGMGFFQLVQELPQERLLGGPGWHRRYGIRHEGHARVHQGGKAFGKPIFSFQNTHFKRASRFL